mmetsp:Transcript_8423/g.12720  ORF Transcript_8423/g.12720 Transcript_8423/m.12720 type:complete len:150 (-) Transcript_8423:8-457(-)
MSRRILLRLPISAFLSRTFHTSTPTHESKPPSRLPIEFPVKGTGNTAQVMLQSVMNNLQQMSSSGNLPMDPGKHGMIAFGIGKDKHGRNMAKFGKIMKNDAGETTEEKYMEKCLDPEREKLEETPPEPIDDGGNCIEVESFDVDPEGQK